MEGGGDGDASDYQMDPFDDDEAATELEMIAFSEAHSDGFDASRQLHHDESQAAEADLSAFRREEDPTTNLYDLAREEDSLNALISPEEFPDMMDDLMMGDDDEIQQTSHIASEPSLDDTTEQSESYDKKILPSDDQRAGEFEEYELIDDEDIGAVSIVGETLHGSEASGPAVDEDFSNGGARRFSHLHCCADERAPFGGR